MHGLNLYDYSARYYEPALGRFTSVDPMAEKYYSISPYAYCLNNPLKYIDPTGMDLEDLRQTEFRTWQQDYQDLKDSFKETGNTKIATDYVRADGTLIVRANDGRSDIECAEPLPEVVIEGQRTRSAPDYVGLSFGSKSVAGASFGFSQTFGTTYLYKK